MQKRSQKKSGPTQKALLSLILLVSVFLTWLLFHDPDSNQAAEGHVDNAARSQVISESQPSSHTSITSESKPEKTAPIDEVFANNQPKRVDALAGDADKKPQPKEYKGLNAEQQLAYAKNDLAERLMINVDEIDSQGVQRVTWRSSATGCPKPGRNYMQVMVPGVLIKMQANEQSYRYHATTNGRPFYCPAGQAETPAPSADGALE